MHPNTDSEPALLFDMKNLNIDDEDASPGAIREELERTNKTLTLSAIRRHEPYQCLPYQYLPIPDVDHRPPLFIYGLALNFEEIDEYILRPETPVSCEMSRAYGMDPLPAFIKYLRELFSVEKLVLSWCLGGEGRGGHCDLRTTLPAAPDVVPLFPDEAEEGLSYPGVQVF
ncbi:hypothetical protein BD779DRAFT_768169 [Infundibulicybe gibba]|nr:hypothetical protein BD779DRAFT_768169 [Infundibulicybe gibba]